MHEHSLMKSLISKISITVEQNGGIFASRITVTLGALSNMSPDHFREHFEEAARGSVAQDAILDIRVNDDIHHEDSQWIRLESVDVETEET